MKQPGYLERLAEIISKSKQLEYVGINYCKMDGAMIAPIIAALHTAIHTMKDISFSGTSWNSDEAILQLIQFIATAPKLEYCYIGF